MATVGSHHQHHDGGDLAGNVGDGIRSAACDANTLIRCFRFTIFFPWAMAAGEIIEHKVHPNYERQLDMYFVH